MTTAVFLAPTQIAGGPFFIPGGNQPANGGQLFTYQTGSSTKLATYTTSSGSVAYSNPIVLDSGGFITGSGEIWLIQSSTYRFILAPSTDTDPPASPYWTRDSISGINDIATQINANSQEWINASTTPVFSNASSFVISGDQRQTFTVGRRVKTTNSGGTIYGTITSSVFTTSTAVGIAPDSSGLDAGLSAVSYGLLSTPNGSLPWTNVSTSGLAPQIASLVVGSSSPAIFGLVRKRKTADQTATSTTTFVNDNHLLFPIGSNEEWIGTFNLGANFTASVGIKLALTSPAGSTMEVNSVFAGASGEVVGTNQQTPGVTFLSYTSSSANGVVRAAFWVLNSTTVGNIALQFAGNASTGTLTLRKGSFLEATKVA